MGTVVSRLDTMTQLSVNMMLTLLMLLTTVMSMDTREDGKCGPDNLAPSGRPAKCDHIPPFPTCCQINGHCGWDCDDVHAAPDPPPVAPVAPSATRPLVLENDPVRVPAVSSSGGFRDDGRCGSEFPLDDGTPAGCDPNSEYFCCSAHGYCGGTGEHCTCDTCVNYRPAGFSGGAGGSSLSISGRVRSDRRCGAEFPLEDGSPSECDGATDNHCCSNWGYCGPGADHCECPTCVDYRTPDQKVRDWVGLWRKDRRCGPEFPLPDNSGPTQCNPDSAKFCCSQWGYCGGDGEHCGCPTCVNNRDINK